MKKREITITIITIIIIFITIIDRSGRGEVCKNVLIHKENLLHEENIIYI